MRDANGRAAHGTERATSERLGEQQTEEHASAEAPTKRRVVDHRHAVHDARAPSRCGSRRGRRPCTSGSCGERRLEAVQDVGIPDRCAAARRRSKDPVAGSRARRARTDPTSAPARSVTSIWSTRPSFASATCAAAESIAASWPASGRGETLRREQATHGERADAAGGRESQRRTDGAEAVRGRPSSRHDTVGSSMAARAERRAPSSDARRSGRDPPRPSSSAPKSCSVPPASSA